MIKIVCRKSGIDNKIDAGDKCYDYYEKLKQRGILVRNRTKDPLLKGCVRITIGTSEQTKKLVKALEEIKNEYR